MLTAQNARLQTALREGDVQRALMAAQLPSLKTRWAGETAQQLLRPPVSAAPPPPPVRPQPRVSRKTKHIPVLPSPGSRFPDLWGCFSLWFSFFDVHSLLVTCRRKSQTRRLTHAACCGPPPSQFSYSLSSRQSTSCVAAPSRGSGAKAQRSGPLLAEPPLRLTEHTAAAPGRWHCHCFAAAACRRCGPP